MSYQNVGTPRFYVSWGDWIKSLGIPVHRRTLLNPYTAHQTSTAALYSQTAVADSGNGVYPANINKGANFWFYLNHTLSTKEVYLKRVGGSETDYHYDMGTQTDTVNYFSHGNAIEYDGWSLRVGSNTGWDTTFNSDTEKIYVGWRNVPDDATSTGNVPPITKEIGCVVYGRKYDMPHSPDLNLKLSYEYDGIKTIQTKGGATLSNASYTKPADWGDRGAWQIGTYGGHPTPNYRSGRRIWDLSFSYLSDTDVFPINASTTKGTFGSDTGYADSDTTGDNQYGTEFHTTILSGEDFFSVVWNKTMGAGNAPFIFQPDGGGGVTGAGNFNLDQFAICRFDQSSLQYEQVANNVYNVKLKIRECW